MKELDKGLEASRDHAPITGSSVLTEPEAFQTQCCGPDGCGRFNDNPYPARWCTASACMAWRWRQSGSAIDGPSGRELSFNHNGYAHLDGKPVGFCGLAGDPR